MLFANAPTLLFSSLVILPFVSNGEEAKVAESQQDLGYVKLNDDGKVLPNSAKHWSCVLDTHKNLIWEVKTSDKKLRDAKHTYTWYDPDNSINGGSAGTQNYGNCEGSDCDTYSYINVVNKQRLCGFDDWRLPNKTELLSIIHNGRPDLDVVFDYFPNTPSAWFWTSTIGDTSPHYAWIVNFPGGSSYESNKYSHHRIRLVREKK